jgi:hypothetical protein
MNIFELTTVGQFNLMGIARDIKGTQSHEEIIDIVEKHFSVATVEITRTPKLDVGELSIGAHYDPESDEEGDDAIFINILFSEDGPAEFTWGKESKKYFLYKLKDTLKHEVLHMTQYRNRDFHPGSEGSDNRDLNYEYMSRPDEIEAYAMNIGDEFIRNVGKDGAIDLLRMAKKTAQFKNELGQFLSPDLLAYFALFNFDSNNPVIKKLIKKIYQYIQSQ